MSIEDGELRVVRGSDLKLLLEKKRKYIGKKPNLELILSGLFFFLPLIFTDFSDYGEVSGEVFKWLFICFGVAVTIAGMVMSVNALKNKYSHTQLYEDIMKLEPPAKKFSLVAIKDTFNSFANRYLLYFDEKWQCWFFFSFRTSENDIQNIKNKLSEKLKVPAKNIAVEFKAQQVQRKFAPADNTVNTYEHKLYKATISDFTDTLKQDKFKIDGVQYRWMTTEEMLKNKLIVEKNLSVVSFVKDYA